MTVSNPLPAFLRTAPRLAVLVIGLAATVLACGDATGPVTPVGDFSLATVNGKPVPYRLFADTGFSLDIAKGTLSLKADGSFLATLRSEERVQNHLSVYADTGTGTWAVVGSTLTFTAPDSSKQTALFAGSGITLIDSSGVAPLTYLYARR